MSKFDMSATLTIGLGFVGIGVPLIILSLNSILEEIFKSDGELGIFIAGVMFFVSGILFMMKNSNKNKNKINISNHLKHAANLAVIISIFVAWAIFDSESENQKNIELNSHISDIVGLETELKINQESLSTIINEDNESIKNHVLFFPIVNQNLKSMISDNKISNIDLKTQLIQTEINLEIIDLQLKTASDPNFLLINPEDWVDRKFRLTKNVTYQIENNYLPHLSHTINQIETYRSCLQNEKDIIKCNN